MKRDAKKGIGLLLSLLIVLGASACSLGKAEGSGEIIEVKTAAAEKGRAQKTVEVTGSLLPSRTVDIESKLTGRVSSVLCDVGDKVQAGQLLLQVDAKELKAQFEQAAASVEQAEQQAGLAKINIETAKLQQETARIAMERAKLEKENAQKNYNRIKTLAEAGVVSQSQLEEAELKLQQAQKQYETAVRQYRLAEKQKASAEKQYAIASGPGIAQAEAAKNVIKAQLDNTRITCPITGIVTNRYINPGELATTGAALLTVADTSSLKLKGTVKEDVIPYLHLGQKVRIEMDALPGRVYHGRITEIGPLAESTGQLFPVEVAVDNPGQLMPGMTARAVITFKGPEGIVVPLSAVKNEKGKNYVFVIDDRDRVKRKEIKLGFKGDKEAVVLKGIKPGDRVAASNIDLLRDGMRVKDV